ncbi:hypothetical protein B0H14DRAFT_2770245 [Mycena olivaceomarginata]|nr:hypothetical protein B0H14DRAFT_2770245 [Mycena olivaceomarginata]
MVSILHFIFLQIISVQSLPTPDMSLDLDSNLNFNTTGNSSAIIDIKLSVQNVVQPMQGIKASAPIGCTGTAPPSESLRPITSSIPVPSSPVNAPRSSGFPLPLSVG